MNLEFEKMFAEMPQEMKEATIKHKAAITRLRRAENQLKLWRMEVDEATRAWRAEERAYGFVSMNWNPATNKMENQPEEFSEKAVQ